ncbi:unnamed protein product [Boreogadus saida]
MQGQTWAASQLARAQNASNAIWERSEGSLKGAADGGLTAAGPTVLGSDPRCPQPAAAHLRASAEPV